MKGLGILETKKAFVLKQGNDGVQVAEICGRDRDQRRKTPVLGGPKFDFSATPPGLQRPLANTTLAVSASMYRQRKREDVR
jgi:hypothetical protein